MKKILVTLFIAAIALCGCISHEMKDNASFEGLVKIYVDDPVGAKEIFSQTGNVERVDSTLKAAIVENLKSKGFELVANRTDAQIIFRPLLTASQMQPESQFAGAMVSKSEIGTSSSSTYVTLEIQAILPNTGDIWSWRGFSPEMMSTYTLTSGSIVQQVNWCLAHFPPEQNPDRLSEIKKERKERKIKSEENPFKEVLIKDREKNNSI